MAKDKAKNDKISKKVSFAYVHKLAAGVSLLSFVVVIIAGFMAQARAVTIAYRSLLVIIVISLASRILIKVLATYEEMNGDKA